MKTLKSKLYVALVNHLLCSLGQVRLHWLVDLDLGWIPLMWKWSVKYETLLDISNNKLNSCNKSVCFFFQGKWKSMWLWIGIRNKYLLNIKYKIKYKKASFFHFPFCRIFFTLPCFPDNYKWCHRKAVTKY